jgi:hypothetical protein
MSKIGNIILGSLAISTGACWTVFILRGLIWMTMLRRSSIDPWQTGGAILVLPIAASLVWIGVRALQRAGGRQLAPPRVRWGRLAFGCFTLFIAVKGQFTPNEGPFFPDNADQAIGMKAASILIELGAIALIVTALRRKEKILVGDSATDATAR